MDGNILLSLTLDNLKTELDLSGLQAKKVLKDTELTKNPTAESGGGG